MSWEDVCKYRFTLLAWRRLAATALAARLYRIEHGAWPDSLDQLVPAYLAAVPRDPFTAGGHPLRFLKPPDDPELTALLGGPVIYSVGVNGVDDGGSGQKHALVLPETQDLTVPLGDR